MADVKQILIEVEIDSRGVVKNADQINKKLKDIGTSAKVAQKGFTDMNSAAGIAGSTVTEFGRLVSDLPYGIQGVANNLSQLGSMFSLLVVSAGKMNNKLSTSRNVFNLIKDQIFGPVGVLVLFQGLVAAIELISRRTKEANEELKEFNNNTVFQGKASQDYLNILKSENVANEDKLKIVKGLVTANKDLAKAIDAGGDPLQVTTAYLERIGKEEEIRSNILDLQKEFADSYGNIIPTVERLRENEAEITRLRDPKLRGTDPRSAASQIKSLEAQNKKIAELVSLRIQEAEAIGQRNKLIEENIVLEGEDFSAFDSGAEFSEEFIRGILEGTEKIEDPLLLFLDPDKIDGELDDSLKELFAPALAARKEILDEVLATDDPADFYQLQLDELGLFLDNEQLLREMSYEDYEALRLKEKQLDDAITQSEMQNAFALIDARQQLYDAISGSLNSLSGLFGEATDAGKGFALAQIAFDVATGYTQGLDISQKTAAATVPGAAFAFPIFYAQQIASVLAAAGKAKQILSASKAGGGGVPTATAPQVPSQGPQFNVVGAAGQNQLAAAIAGTQQQPVKAYVVSSDVTTAQQLERNIVQGASI